MVFNSNVYEYELLLRYILESEILWSITA